MCGIGAVYKSDKIKKDLFKLGLTLQHRGPDSAGISISKGGEFLTLTNYGDVKALFNGPVSNLRFDSDRGIVNVRFSTTGDSNSINAQPVVVGNVALSHNGNLFNAEELSGRHNTHHRFETTVDSEVLACILNDSSDFIEGAGRCIGECDGAYNFTAIDNKGRIGVFRDPHGFHPLHIGQKNGTYYAASEDLCLTALQVYSQTELKPGELAVFSDGGIEIHKIAEPQDKLCFFEALYFMWYGSTFNGVYADDIRSTAGELLAEKYPVEADFVVPILYSGISYAHGYSKRSGIPLAYALCKNPFVGRTYQHPDGKGEEVAEEVKLTRAELAALKNPPMAKKLRGKKIVIPDDSIVSGNVSRDIVERLFSEIGVDEVHLRVASPPIAYTCLAGMYHGPRKRLVAARAPVHDIDETNRYVAQKTGATSVGYLTQKDIISVLPKGIYCFSCVDGNYHFTVPKTPRTDALTSL